MTNDKGIRIADIQEGSIAEELDIIKGDLLISINGKSIADIIEYKYILSSEYIEVEIEKQDGERWIFEIEKDYDEDLGFVFENSLLDKPKACKNKCIFCFIDQLPKGLRKSVYFKDDDVRLSFLQGNYVTFTNTSDEEVQRIIDYKISPINISVHATDEEVRRFMLNNDTAGNIKDIIKKLADNNIKINCQVVLCPSINDGNILDKTIANLSAYWPNVMSIAVVPVAITKHREKLYSLTTYDKDLSQQVIKQVTSWQDKLNKQFGTRFVFLADEFYIMAERDIPPYKNYEEGHQLEDGIGMIAKFEMEFEKSLANFRRQKVVPFNREITVVTGKLAYNYIKKYCKKIEEVYNNIKINVYPIINTLFGDSVTVSGLIPGKDIIEQLKDKSLGSKILLPSNLLRAEDVVLIDNVTIEDIEKSLDCNVVVVQTRGDAFVDEILY